MYAGEIDMEYHAWQGGPGLNCGTYASLPVLKYFQAFETHPPPGMYFSLHGTKILSTILHPPTPGMYFSLHGTKIFSTILHPPTPCVGTKV